MLNFRLAETFHAFGVQFMPYFIDKPHSPHSVDVKDVQKTQVCLKWTAPDDDGGSPITSYIVEKKEGNRKMWQHVGTVTGQEMVVTGLFEGNQYSFRVTAENTVGLSEPTELDNFVTAKSQIGKQLICQ